MTTGTAAAAPTATLSVRPGGTLVTAVGGFAPSTVVTERVDRGRTVHAVRADRHGTVQVRVRVPHALGRHRLVLVGRLAALRARPSVPARGAAVGDVQVLSVEIPRVAVVVFQVARGGSGSGTAGAGMGRDPGGAGALGPGRGSAGAPAATGLDLRVPVGVAVLLLLLGVTLSAAGAQQTVYRARAR